MDAVLVFGIGNPSRGDDALGSALHDMMEAHKRETGGLEPRAQGNGGGHGKLGAVQSWITARMDAKPDLTLNDLVGELADQHGIAIHRVSVWRFLRGLGLTHKKRPASRRTKAA